MKHHVDRQPYRPQNLIRIPPLPRFPAFVSEFVRRGLVRPLALALCTLAVLMGLPRLADLFRAPLHPDFVTMSTGAPGVRDRKAEQASIKPAAPSIAPKASNAAAPNAPAPAPKNNEVRMSRPHAQDNVRQGAINLQAAQDVLNGRAPAAAPAATPAQSVLSDGYLPPWDALRGKEEQVTQAARQNGGSLTVRVAAQPAPYVRRERVSKRRSAHRRSRGWGGGGFGFFGF